MRLALCSCLLYDAERNLLAIAKFLVRFNHDYFLNTYV